MWTTTCSSGFSSRKATIWTRKSSKARPGNASVLKVRATRHAGVFVLKFREQMGGSEFKIPSANVEEHGKRVFLSNCEAVDYCLRQRRDHVLR